jgi:hypothetical protein
LENEQKVCKSIMLNVDCSRWNIFELAVLVSQIGVVARIVLFVFTVLEYSCHFGTVHFGNSGTRSKARGFCLARPSKKPQPPSAVTRNEL